MRGRTKGGLASVTDIDLISTQLDELHQTIRDIAKRGLKESDVMGIGNKFDAGKPGIPANQFKEYDLRLIIYIMNLKMLIMFRIP